MQTAGEYPGSHKYGAWGHDPKPMAGQESWYWMVMLTSGNRYGHYVRMYTSLSSLIVGVSTPGKQPDSRVLVCTDWIRVSVAIKILSHDINAYVCKCTYIALFSTFLVSQRVTMAFHSPIHRVSNCIAVDILMSLFES